MLANFKSKMLGDSLISFGSKVAGAALAFIMLVTFSQLMTADQFGYFGISINASILLSTIAGLGLPVAVMRFYPGHLAKGERDLARGFLTGGYRAILMVGMCIVAFGAGLSLMGAFKASTGSVAGPVLIALLALFIALSDYAAGALRAQQSVAWSALPRDIGWRIAAPLLAVLSVGAGFRMHNWLAVTISIGTLGVITMLQCRKSHTLLARLDSRSGAPQTNWPSWRKPLVPIWAASILFALTQQADVLVIGGLIGPDAAGSYFAAQKTAALLGLAMIAGGQVAAPMMASAYQVHDLASLQRICRLLAMAIAAVTLAGLVLVVLAGDLLLSVFNQAYVSAYQILLIFALAATVDAVSGPTAYLMQMTKLENHFLLISAAVYGAVLAAQLVFVPQFGVIAAASLSAAGVVTWNIIAILLIRKKIGVDPSLLGIAFPPRGAKA